MATTRKKTPTTAQAAETRAVESLIRYRTNIGWACKRLHEPEFSITDIPSQTALILQGGGALGAFECGVAQAMEEAGVRPDIVAGVSIGAFNGVIIAANPGNAAGALRDFWKRLSLDMPQLAAHVACSARGRHWPSACRPSSSRAGPLCRLPPHHRWDGPASTIRRRSRSY